MNQPFFDKTHCDRCGNKLQVRTMSKFNQDTICPACKEDEKLAPGYEAADKAEVEAVKSGDYNYPGVGLSAEDRAFLAQRRKER